MSTSSTAAKRPTEGKDEKRDDDVAAVTGEMWMEPRESCDAELVIGGTSAEEAKRRVHVHKLIVSQFAPVLGAMLSCGDKAVHLAGGLNLPLDFMPALVQLIYTPHAAAIVTDFNARAIAQLARYFDAATPRMMVDRHMASSYAGYLHECMALAQSSRVVTATRSDGSEHKWTLERFNAKHEFSMAMTVNSANRQTTAKEARSPTTWCRILDPTVPDTPAFVAPQGAAELLAFAIDHQLPELARWCLLLLRVDYLVESPVGSNFIYADAKTGKPVNAFKMLTADQLRAFLVPVVQRLRDTGAKNLVLPFSGSAGL